tara:strand:- start:13424 stop:13954 length:531 start_codon:yes stop_codon:yes gene_type:complete
MVYRSISLPKESAVEALDIILRSVSYGDLMDLREQHAIPWREREVREEGEPIYRDTSVILSDPKGCVSTALISKYEGYNGHHLKLDFLTEVPGLEDMVETSVRVEVSNDDNRTAVHFYYQEGTRHLGVMDTVLGDVRTGKIVDNLYRALREIYETMKEKYGEEAEENKKPELSATG